jgi:hypothetical protein
MRKQEILHLHALCALIRVYLEESREVPSDCFRAYEDHDVSPSEIHRRKDVHRRAQSLLLDSLAALTDDLSDHSSPRQSND